MNDATGSEPCPWCGSAGVDLETDLLHAPVHYVACEDERCDVRPETPLCTSPEVARIIWDTRALQTQSSIPTDETLRLVANAVLAWSVGEHTEPIYSQMRAILGDVPRGSDRLHELAKECANELEEEIRARYHYPAVHPALQQKYERDMSTVMEMRAILNAQRAPAVRVTEPQTITDMRAEVRATQHSSPDEELGAWFVSNARDVIQYVDALKAAALATGEGQSE